MVIFVLYLLAGKSDLGVKTALAFALGAIASGMAGFVGMYISVRANIRVAAAAGSSLNKALKTALRGGGSPVLFDLWQWLAF